MVTLGTNTEDHSQIWQFTRVPFPLLSLSQQTKESFGRQTQILQESPWRDWWVKHPLCVKHSLMGDSGPSRLWLCSTGPMLSFLYHTSCSPCCGWNYLGASCLHEHLHSVPVSWLSTLLPQFHVQHLRVATVVHRELCSWFQLSRDFFLEYPGKIRLKRGGICMWRGKHGAFLTCVGTYRPWNCPGASQRWMWTVVAQRW